MPRRALLLAAALFLGTGPALAAQDRALVTGRVLDEASGEPVAGATVELIGQAGEGRRQGVSDAEGRFALTVRFEGTYRMRATRIGLAQALSAPIRIGAADTLDVILRMNVDAVRLPALEVVSEARRGFSPRLSEFHYRAERGWGRFIHREEIRHRQPVQLSDLITEQGFTLERIGRQSRLGLVNRRSQCAPLVYVDGGLAVRAGVERGDTLAYQDAAEAVNMIHPYDVYGIEVYSGPATVPGQFGGSNARCGVIVIWTAGGGEG